ncbi:contactin-like isoform X2 [Gordionus sp. m RMFG-2023]
MTNWTSADEICRNMGSTLLSVGNKNEHLFITNYLYYHDPALKTWFTSGVKNKQQNRWYWRGEEIPLTYDSGWNSEMMEVYRKEEIDSQKLHNMFSNNNLPQGNELKLREAYHTINKRYISDLHNFSGPFNNDKVWNEPSLDRNNYMSAWDQESSQYLVYQYSYRDGAWKWNSTSLRLQDNNNRLGAFICEKSLNNKFHRGDDKFTSSSYEHTPSLPSHEQPFSDLYSSSENFGLISSLSSPRASLQEGFDSSIAPSGVSFILQPKDTTWDTKSIEKRIQLSCKAIGYPYPSYTWFKNQVPIISTAVFNHSFGYGAIDLAIKNVNNFDEVGYDRLSITNGILDIFDPESDIDQGEYYCSASNIFGTALSSKARLSFGFIKDFKPDALPIKAYIRTNTMIPCQAPDAYPDVRFYWFKDYLPNFVPSDARIFHSWKGNLYFSTLDLSDDGNYICMIKSSVAQTGANTLGKTSKEIKLSVSNTFVNSRRKPIIEVGFPSIFPSNPLMGQEVRIECVAYGDPIPQYNWTKADSQLPAKARMEDFNRVLIIPDARPTDDGNYRCKASNVIGETEQGLSLSVSAAPVFTLPLKDKFVTPGSKIELICEAYGKPEVKYRWFKDGKLFDKKSLQRNGQLLDDSYNMFGKEESTNKPRIQLLLDPNEKDKIFRQGLFYEPQIKIVVIRDVTDKDNGIYQCEASNGHGTRYSSAQVKVIAFKPVFTVSKSHAPTHTYNNLDISPPLTFDSAHIHNTDSLNKNTISDLMGLYYLLSPTKVLTEGGNLTLICSPKASPSPKFKWFFAPLILSSNARYSHYNHDWDRNRNRHSDHDYDKNYYRYFSASQHQNPASSTIPLYIDAKRVKVGDKNMMMTGNRKGNNLDNKINDNLGGDLNIESLRFSDTGIYTCVAENYLGSVTVTTQVIVARSTTIIKHPSSVSSTIPGVNLTLECAALAEPGIELAFEWTHNGVLIDTNSKYYGLLFELITPIKDSSRLVIRNSNLIHSGEYLCIARTSIDSVPSRIAKVTIAGIPSAPSMITASDISTTTAKLTWTNGGDNGQPIVRYVIQGKTDYRDWFVLAEVLATGVKNLSPSLSSSSPQYYSSYSHSLQNLLPRNTYTFRIASTNALGQGKFSSESARYVTASDAPRVAPRQLRGGGGNMGDLVMRWEPLLGDEHGGPGLHYELFWIKKEDWLRSNQKGKFEVALLHDPNKNLYVTRVGKENYFMEYMVKIRAINSMGKGPESELVTVMSAEDVPTKEPTLVQAFPHNSTAINVRWKGLGITRDREIIRGQLLGYKIQYGLMEENINKIEDKILPPPISSNPENGLDESRLNKDNEFVANDRRTTILYGAIDVGTVIGIVPNCRYWVKVMAFNSAGNGPLSDPVYMNTFRDAPLMQPTDISISGPNSDGAIRITWSGIYTSNNEEPLEGYKIRIWEGREDISDYVDIPVGLINFHDIYSFPKHKVFKIRILGYSRGGDGKMSQAFEVCLQCNEIEKQDHIERLSQEYMAKFDDDSYKTYPSSHGISNIPNFLNYKFLVTLLCTIYAFSLLKIV